MPFRLIALVIAYIIISFKEILSRKEIANNMKIGIHMHSNDQH